MDLYIYDREKGLLGIVDATTSVRWRRKYYEPGEVEIHLPASVENLQLLAEGRIIKRVDRKEAAIIEGIEADGEDLAIIGRMLSSILERAILSKRYTLRGTAEEAMLAVIPEGTRVVPELMAAEAAGVTTTKVEVQATYKNLLTVEQRLAKAAGLGFRVLYEPGVMTFEVYAGTDHSVQQSALPMVIFSDEFGNLMAPKYTKTSVDYKNRAYVAGTGEGDERTVVIVDLSEGEEVRELYVDAKDIQLEDGMTDDEYLALLYQRGLDKLAECEKVENFEADGGDVENFAYMTDWDLGDIITVQDTRLGIIMHERVTEIEEVYEKGTATYTPTFGSALPEKLNLGDDTE